MYHGMSLEAAAEYVYELVKDLMPHILHGGSEEDFYDHNDTQKIQILDGMSKEQFIQSYMKALERQVSGTDEKVIEYLPGIFETDEKFLNVRKKVMEGMLKMTEEDPEDQIFKKTGIREKDCHRLSIIMSASVEKTFFGPTALTQLYSKEYLERATEYFEIMENVGFKPFVYIRKRSDSSNGSLSRTSDMTIFQKSLNRFAEIISTKPELLEKYEYPTLLLSRIMPKNNLKPRMVEGENGISHAHDREIKGKVKEKLAHLIDRDNLATGQHRSVCNVTDVERGTQMITQQAIEACKYTYFTMMRYKPDLMALYYNCGYTHVVCTDATKFDQSISELLMRQLYTKYSNAIKIMDLERFRDKKHITWYNKSKKCVYSLNELVKQHEHDDKLELERLLKEGKIDKKTFDEGIFYLDELSKLNFIGGVDSGNPHVSHDGKMNMIGSLYVMFKYFMGVDLTPHEFSKNFFEFDYDSYVACMKAHGLNKWIVKDTGGKKGRGVIVNSSDDNFFATTTQWVADAYKQLIIYCSEQKVRPFLLAEPDAEFLSQILIDEEGDMKHVKQIGNPGRKMQSRLVGEYTNRNDDGTFKDMVQATNDRDEELKLSKIGTRLLDLLEESWESEYGETHSDCVKRIMSGVEIATPVEDALKARRITANWADKELERSPDKAYYRDDIVDAAHEETMSILFTNISPVQTYDLYERMELLDYCCEKIGQFGKNLNDVLEYTIECIANGYAPAELEQLYNFEKLRELVTKCEKYSNIDYLKEEIERLRALDDVKEFGKVTFKD